MMKSRQTPTLRLLRLALPALLLGAAAPAFGAARLCEQPLAPAAVPAHFERLALKQLALEFGDGSARIDEITASAVGEDLLRIDARAQYRVPGQAGPTTRYLTGWLARCSGTLVLRGNTWLADGSLEVPRYRREDLPGRGVTLGSSAAPVHVIAFVDSRCPQCHRLIDYAQKQTAGGRLFIELRQVAFLASAAEAVTDTRLAESPLVSTTPGISIAEHVQMLSGLPHEGNVDRASSAYRQALALIEANTRAARDILHLSGTPGVLVQDPTHPGRFRVAGHWEMNRLFQPDL